MLNIIAEIVENEPSLFEGIIDLCFQDLGKITQHPKLTPHQKLAYLSSLVTALSENKGLPEESQGNYLLPPTPSPLLLPLLPLLLVVCIEYSLPYQKN